MTLPFHGQFLYQRLAVPVGSKPKYQIELLPIVREVPCGWSRQQACDLLMRIPDSLDIKYMARSKDVKFKVFRDGASGPTLMITIAPDATHFRITMTHFDGELLHELKGEEINYPPFGTMRMWKFRAIEQQHRKLPYKHLSAVAGQLARMHIPDWHDFRMHLGDRAFQRQTVLKWERQAAGQSDFENLTKGLDGIKEVYYSDGRGGKDNKSFQWLHSDAANEDDEDAAKKKVALETFVWFPNVAVSVIQSFSYYQLDASFYVFHPYVYVVPMFVVYNTGFPIGLIIGRSETAELFDHLRSGIEKLDHIFGLRGDLVSKFLQLPCLSDKGTGINKFCSKHAIKQFHCHRHIIEEFGSASIGGFICRMILQTENLAEFKLELQRCNDMIMYMARDGQLPEGLTNKYCKLTHQEFNQSTRSFKSRATDDSQLEEAIASWAIWKRGDVAGTTNIQESLHGKLNDVVKKNSKKGVPSFSTNLGLVVEAIEKRQKFFGSTARRNLKDAFMMYCGSRKILSDPLILAQVAQLQGACPECDKCNVSSRMRHKWNVETPFPCKHTEEVWSVKLFWDFVKAVEDGIDQVVRAIVYKREVILAPEYIHVASPVSKKSTNKAPEYIPIQRSTERHTHLDLTPYEQAIAKLGSLIWATLGDKGAPKEYVYLMVCTLLPPNQFQTWPTGEQTVQLFNIMKQRLPKRKT